MGRRWGALAVGLVILVTGSACGGSSKADETKDAAKDTTAKERPTTTTPAKSGSTVVPKSDSDGRQGGAAGESPTTTTTTAAAQQQQQGRSPDPAEAEKSLTQPGPKGQLTMTASLAEACVAPGQTQLVQIKTRKGSGVGYDTVYSDGKSGAMEGHYGGNYGGTTDDDGTFAHAWTISPAAPPGEAKVNVIASHVDYGSAYQVLTFRVADVTGLCG